jgi:hypothetical protein
LKLIFYGASPRIFKEMHVLLQEAHLSFMPVFPYQCTGFLLSGLDFGGGHAGFKRVVVQGYVIERWASFLGQVGGEIKDGTGFVGMAAYGYHVVKFDIGEIRSELGFVA